MTENPDGSFQTVARSITESGELQWGTANGESWSDAVTSSSGVTVSDDGSVRSGSEIPDSGVARWSFDNASTDGTTTIDVWGRDADTITQHNATNHGATTGTAGANQTYTTNEAYDFDGDNDWVEHASLGKSGSVSYAFWINADAIGGYIWTNYRSGILADNGEVRIWFSGDTIGFSFYDGEWKTVTGTTTLSTQTWYHVIVVWDESSQTAHIYINGSEDASASFSASMVSADRSYGIMAQRDGSGNSNGRFDDGRVYGKALSATEASNLYTTGSI